MSREEAIEILSDMRAEYNLFGDEEEATRYHVISWAIQEMKATQLWIPCSKRLPEEHESIWAKAKGTDRWSEAMWEKQSDEVIVTELFEDGTTRTDTACTHDGEWYVKIKAVKRKIIAWMPLPEPYKEGQDERT